uniref:Transmembrane protein 213 n=1 Tax=Panagrellus redivivus TaxID=6233 RepID=A0A7E4VZW5_PANRE
MATHGRPQLRALVAASVVSLCAAVWDQLPELPPDYVKPTTFKEKHWGQWCRNFTTARHTQCPQGSFFHWYTCCGADNTECCIGIQTTFIVIFFWFSVIALFCCIWGLLLHYDLIYPRKDTRKAKQLEQGEYSPVPPRVCC